MKPDGPMEGQTFEPSDWAKMERWIEERWATHNLYFSINEPSSNAANKKLSKSDITSVRSISVDLDPGDGDMAKERAALRARMSAVVRDEGLPEPTIVVDTGGGFHMHWLLVEKHPSDKMGPWAEGQARAFAEKFGGDNTHNIDRILRLPGTRNLPGDGKRRAGRVVANTKVIHQSSARYSSQSLSTSVPPMARAQSNVGDNETDAVRRRCDEAEQEVELSGYEFTSSIEDLDADLREKLEQLLAAHKGFASLWAGDRPVGRDASASGYRAALAAMLGRVGGFDIIEWAQLCHSWPFAQGRNPITARSLAREWVKFAEKPQRDLDRHLEVQPIEGPADQSNVDADAASAKANSAQRRIELVPFHAAADTALTASNKPLVKGLLDQGTLSVMYGPSNVGKTFAAMSIGFHIGAGIPWGGMKVERGAVVYVAAEGGAGARKRASALRRHYPTVSDGIDFHLILQSLDLRRPDADVAPLIDALLKLGRPIALVVLDTLSRVMAGGEENGSTDMGAMVRHFDQIRAATGAHVLVVHHSGKDAARGARGHSLLRAATDTEIEIANRQIVVTKQRDLDKSWSRAIWWRTMARDFRKSTCDHKGATRLPGSVEAFFKFACEGTSARARSD